MKRSLTGRRIFLITGGTLLFASILYFSLAFRQKPASDSRLLLTMIMDGINSVHYSPHPVNDSFSYKIFQEYLKRVDFNKKIFNRKDIDELSSYRFSIDDEIKDSSYAFFDAVMKIYSVRLKQAYRYSKMALADPIDFSADENIETDGDKLEYPTDTLSQKNEWRKYMKLQVLQQLNEKAHAQEKARAKSDTVKVKAFDQLEESARAAVKKSNEEYFSRMNELERIDWLGIYLDCISNVEDPHTEYFAPVNKQNFDIQMSGQLEGIGAQLQQKDGEIKITSIVPGSASWKQGKLKANDVIQKVGQGSQEPVNVEGMRLDKAIQLIRGKKGTEVRLTVKKPDGTIIVVPIIRDIVVIEATYAQSTIIHSNGNKIGYIRLPEFYAPVDQRGGRSCSDDVKKELQKLKSENVTGIILDLRDNGGGSLQEAVKLGGLFIKSGPVVQVRQRGGRANVLSDSDPEIIYDGPLTIMVNGNSASASEIIAAAMQDYHRAVVIGSRTTYGKGTVQNFYNLDNLVSHQQSSAPVLGSIKITIQKFYRVNGGSTQLRGVTPDIILPDPYAEIPNGEKENKYAIKWDEIPPAIFEPWKAGYSYDKLRAGSEKRMSSSNAFQLIQEEARDFKERSENTIYPLSYKKYSDLQKILNDKEKKYEAILSDTGLVAVSNLPADLPRINADSVSLARNNQFFKNLKKDIYISEAATVVGEMR